MRYACLLGCLFLCWCGAASAQPEQERLTLAEAVRTALANHPLMRVAEYELEAAHAQVRGAQALASPELWITPGVLGPEGSDELVSLVQPLEINGARRARTRIAAGQLDERVARGQQSRQDLILQVKQAYWGAALAQQIRDLDLENLKYAQTLAEAAVTQCALGNQPQVQVQRAEVETARALVQSLQSRAAAEQQRTALNAAMGRPPQTPLELADEPTAVKLQFTLEELQDLAVRQRPEILQAQAAESIAAGEVAAARAERKTDLAVQARLTPEGAGGVGLSLNFPQLGWGSSRAERQRTEAVVQARGASLEVVRQQVRFEVLEALSVFRAAQCRGPGIRTENGGTVAPTRRPGDHRVPRGSPLRSSTCWRPAVRCAPFTRNTTTRWPDS